MDNVRNVWIGSYSAEQNAYDVSQLGETCDSNENVYRMGFGGYSPICCGETREEVVEKLETVRAGRETLFREFEDAMLDLVSDLADEDADVHIVYEDEECTDLSVGDTYMGDGITMIPEDMRNRPFPVIGLHKFYKDVFANSMGASTLEEALNCVAEEILSIAEEMWKDPQDCPYCSEEAE